MTTFAPTHRDRCPQCKNLLPADDWASILCATCEMATWTGPNSVDTTWCDICGSKDVWATYQGRLYCKTHLDDRRRQEEAPMPATLDPEVVRAVLNAAGPALPQRIRAIMRLHSEPNGRPMSLRSLAVAADMDKTTLHYIVSGQTKDPRISTIARIARALGVGTGTLIGEGPR